jgi:magnesium and cobalt transporter
MSDNPSGRPPRAATSDGGPSLGALLRHWLIGGRASAETLHDTIEELVGTAVADQPDASIAGHERQLLANILRMRDRTAIDVMVPRADIVAIDVDTPIDQALAFFVAEGHSRMPVFRDGLDDVLGIVHVKDVLAAHWAAQGDRKSLVDVLRPPQIVAPSMPVLDLLLQMREKRQHMALVIDEFGGIDGLVTIEDLVEEIVGEIEDEHDTDTPPEIVEHPDGTLIADARLPIEEFEARMGIVLTEDERDEAETLGGLVFSLAGRIPAQGERLTHPSGLQFEVIDADPRRIKRVAVHRMAVAAEE